MTLLFAGRPATWDVTQSIPGAQADLTQEPQLAGAKGNSPSFIWKISLNTHHKSINFLPIAYKPQSQGISCDCVSCRERGYGMYENMLRCKEQAHINSRWHHIDKHKRTGIWKRNRHLNQAHWLPLLLTLPPPPVSTTSMSHTMGHLSPTPKPKHYSRLLSFLYPTTCILVNAAS